MSSKTVWLDLCQSSICTYLSEANERSERRLLVRHFAKWSKSPPPAQPQAKAKQIGVDIRKNQKLKKLKIKKFCLIKFLGIFFWNFFGIFLNFFSVFFSDFFFGFFFIE
jgi:hypothetical protein